MFNLDKVNTMQNKFTNINEVPLALAVFLATDNYEVCEDPNTISVTTLIKPVRQIVLPSRVPPGDGLVSLTDMMASRLGNAVHEGIEMAWRNNYMQAMKILGFPDSVINRVVINPTQPLEHYSESKLIPIYLEQRVIKQIGRWKISGKFDFVGEGTVQDFKTTSVFAYKNQSSTGKHKEQGSIYRWLNPEIVTKDELHIHYIFKDWSKKQAQVDATYPPKSFHTQKIPMMNLAETEHFIVSKLHQIEKYMNAEEAEIPLCSDEDLWRTEPKFKYYKNPTKTLRSTANFDNKQEAYIRLNQEGGVGIVKEVPGEVKACKYCAAFSVCSQAQRLIIDGDLKI